MRTRRISFTATAALAAVALFVAGCGGPTSTATGSKPGDGKQVFSDAGCGSCHTLAAAHSNGGTGPILTTIGLPASAVANQVRNGGGGMPSFGGQLTAPQIKAVSEFVASNDGS